MEGEDPFLHRPHDVDSSRIDQEDCVSISSDVSASDFSRDLLPGDRSSSSPAKARDEGPLREEWVLGEEDGRPCQTAEVALCHPSGPRPWQTDTDAHDSDEISTLQEELLARNEERDFRAIEVCEEGEVDQVDGHEQAASLVDKEKKPGEEAAGERKDEIVPRSSYGTIDVLDVELGRRRAARNDTQQGGSGALLLKEPLIATLVLLCIAAAGFALKFHLVAPS